jgi:hypothetical protein
MNNNYKIPNTVNFNNDNAKCIKECDIMTYLTDFITPIFQVLTIELKDYYMNLRTTKCLNTSIMTMYLLLGTEGLKTCEVCSVQNIKERIKNNTNKLNNMNKNTPLSVIDNNIRKREMIFYDQMIDDLFKSDSDPKRVFYYIMITDGSLNKDGLNSNDSYFPGHVFVIEKIPCVTTSKFKIYQSFIGEYTLKGHFNMNHKSLDIDKDELIKILGKTGVLNKKERIDGVSTIFSDNVWSSKTTDAWKKLTHVKSDEYNGLPTTELKFCYQKIYVDKCFEKLNKFAKKALDNLKKDINYYHIVNPADPPLTGEHLKEKMEILERQTNIMKNNSAEK